jgi:hypothetical protein
MVDTLDALTDGPDVAVPIQDGKCLSLLEDSSAVVGHRRGRQDVELVIDADDVIDVHVPVMPRHHLLVFGLRSGLGALSALHESLL